MKEFRALARAKAPGLERARLSNHLFATGFDGNDAHFMELITERRLCFCSIGENGSENGNAASIVDTSMQFSIWLILSRLGFGVSH